MLIKQNWQSSLHKKFNLPLPLHLPSLPNGSQNTSEIPNTLRQSPSNLSKRSLGIGKNERSKPSRLNSGGYKGLDGKTYRSYLEYRKNSEQQLKEMVDHNSKIKKLALANKKMSFDIEI